MNISSTLQKQIIARGDNLSRLEAKRSKLVCRHEAMVRKHLAAVKRRNNHWGTHWNLKAAKMYRSLIIPLDRQIAATHSEHRRLVRMLTGN